MHSVINYHKLLPNYKLYRNGYLLFSSISVTIVNTLKQDQAIENFITQPTIYKVIAYFSLYHELASDRSIVLDITWDYTMAWYPAKKIIYNELPGTHLNRYQSYSNVSHVHQLASTTHARTGL